MHTESFRRRSEKMVRTFILAQSGRAAEIIQPVGGSTPPYDTAHASEAKRSKNSVQVLNAQSRKGKDFQKATGYLIHAEMYGARTSQRRVLGMVAAVRRET